MHSSWDPDSWTGSPSLSLWVIVGGASLCTTIPPGQQYNGLIVTPLSASQARGSRVISWQNRRVKNKSLRNRIPLKQECEYCWENSQKLKGELINRWIYGEIASNWIFLEPRLVTRNHLTIKCTMYTKYPTLQRMSLKTSSSPLKFPGSVKKFSSFSYPLPIEFSRLFHVPHSPSRTRG